MVQGKAFPVGQILCSILRAAPALLQGLAPAEGSGLGVLSRTQAGKWLCQCTATAASLSSVLRAWQKGLGLGARRMPDFWANASDSDHFLFVQPSAVTLLCYQTFFFLLPEAPLKILPELYAPSPIFSLHLSADAWSKLLLLDCSPWTHLQSDSSAIIKG